MADEGALQHWPDISRLGMEDRQAWDDAVRILSKPDGIVARLSALAGGWSAKIGLAGLKIVPGAEEVVSRIAQAALSRAFDVAILGLPAESAGSRRSGMVVVGLSGAVTGFAGAIGFVPDVFVTTLSIMRSVARVAQEAGESLSDADTRLACLSVFGGPVNEDKGSPAGIDLGYFLARSALQGQPVTMLLSEIARRYGVSLSQKLALQAVPFVGAASGAALNVAYLAHYTELAEATFVLRRIRRQSETITLAGAA